MIAVSRNGAQFAVKKQFPLPVPETTLVYLMCDIRVSPQCND